MQHFDILPACLFNFQAVDIWNSRANDCLVFFVLNFTVTAFGEEFDHWLNFFRSRRIVCSFIQQNKVLWKTRLTPALDFNDLSD